MHRGQLKAFAGGKHPNMILDDGGDLTLAIHQKHEHMFKGRTPSQHLQETTTGVHRLYDMARG